MTRLARQARARLARISFDFEPMHVPKTDATDARRAVHGAWCVAVLCLNGPKGPDISKFNVVHNLKIE